MNDDFEVIRILTERVKKTDNETGALMIQFFIEHLNEGETHRMALSLTKNIWDINDKRSKSSEL